MHKTRLALPLAALLATAGCGGGDDREKEPEEPPMKVEDTVFGDLVGTQDKVRDRTDAAMDRHREALESGIQAAEDPPPPPEE